MKTFKFFLKEKMEKTLKNGFELHKNPHHSELAGVLKKMSPTNSARIMIHPKNHNIYMFDNMLHTHHDIHNELKHEDVHLDPYSNKHNYHIIHDKHNSDTIHLATHDGSDATQHVEHLKQNHNFKRMLGNRKLNPMKNGEEFEHQLNKQ